MNNLWETPFGSSRVKGIAELTDCIVDKNSSLELSLLSENMTPKFESLCEKNSQNVNVGQLKAQIQSLTQSCGKFSEKNAKLKQDLARVSSECSALEEKYSNLYRIFTQSEEEK